MSGVISKQEDAEDEVNIQLKITINIYYLGFQYFKKKQ